MLDSPTRPAKPRPPSPSTLALKDAMVQQPDRAALATSSAATGRGIGQQDFEADQNRFHSLLGGLKSAGFFGGGGSSSSSASGAGGGAGTWTPESGGGAGRPVAPVAMPDTSAARSATFARAKDQVGQSASGALAALRSQLGGRGMLGSGMEARGTASVINEGQGELGEVSRDLAGDESDAAQRAAELTYQGGITQRGQDMNAASERDRLRLTARGQDMSAAESRSSREANHIPSIMALWGAFSGRSRGAQY